MKELWDGKEFKSILESDTKYFSYGSYASTFEKTLEHIEEYYPKLKWIDSWSKIGDFNILSTESLLLVEKDTKLWGFFNIYELHGVIVNVERKLVCVYGHEDICFLWLDTEEFTKHHTR